MGLLVFQQHTDKDIEYGESLLWRVCSVINHQAATSLLDKLDVILYGAATYYDAAVQVDLDWAQVDTKMVKAIDAKGNLIEGEVLAIGEPDDDSDEDD